MSPAESQAWSCGASGCASKSFFVCFSYAFSALLIINWKLDDEDPDAVARE
jgi:hypothetical protein